MLKRALLYKLFQNITFDVRIHSILENVTWLHFTCQYLCVA